MNDKLLVLLFNIFRKTTYNNASQIPKFDTISSQAISTLSLFSDKWEIFSEPMAFYIRGGLIEWGLDGVGG